MQSLRSIPRSGAFRLLVLSVVLALNACITHYGFVGGGLPPHIRSMAILPFDNETPSPDLQRELLEAMRRDLQPRLGMREAPQDKADALARGVIRTYDVDVPVGFSANQTQPTTSRRRLQLTVDVQIVDQTSGKTLFERKGLRAEADYPEGGEQTGRREAVRRIVNDMVEGAQSQW